MLKKWLYDKERVVATVGLQGHGKTVFLASLFRDSFFVLAETLKPFSVRAATAKADDVFYGNAITLHELELPFANPRNRPEPAILEFTNVPLAGSQRRRQVRLTFYDIAGEVFSSDRLIAEYATFLSEATDIIILYDPTHEEFSALRAARLLDLICRATGNRRINLIIALSKMDELRSTDEWANILSDLWPDNPPSISSLPTYLKEMDQLSFMLREWWLDPAREARNLLNTLPANTRFCALSAVGHHPIWDCPECNSINPAKIRICEKCQAERLGAALRLERRPEPFRVRDPLFWILRDAGVM